MKTQLQDRMQGTQYHAERVEHAEKNETPLNSPVERRIEHSQVKKQGDECAQVGKSEHVKNTCFYYHEFPK